MRNEISEAHLDRRQRTARIIASRNRVWNYTIGGHPTNPISLGRWEMGLQLTPGRHRKGRPLACGCAKRLKGRPKVAAGMCDMNCHKGLFELRRKTRNLKLWCREDWDWDSDEVAELLDTLGQYRG